MKIKYLLTATVLSMLLFTAPVLAEEGSSSADDFWSFDSEDEEVSDAADFWSFDDEEEEEAAEEAAENADYPDENYEASEFTSSEVLTSAHAGVYMLGDNFVSIQIYTSADDPDNIGIAYLVSRPVRGSDGYVKYDILENLGELYKSGAYGIHEIRGNSGSSTLTFYEDAITIKNRSGLDGLYQQISNHGANTDPGQIWLDLPGESSGGSYDSGDSYDSGYDSGDDFLNFDQSSQEDYSSSDDYNGYEYIDYGNNGNAHTPIPVLEMVRGY